MTTASEPPATLAGIDPEGIDARTIPGVFFRQARASADRVVFRHYRDDRWQPVTWAEVQRCLRERDASLLRFTVDDVLRRVARRGDLFADVATEVQSLP